jgi:hypothetical protein
MSAQPAAKSDYWEEKILNLLRGTNITAPGTVYVGLFLSGNGPSDLSGGVPMGEAGGWTEITGNAYARQSVTFDAPAQQTVDGVPSVAVIANHADITWLAASPAGYGNVGSYGIFDAVSSGNLLYYGALDSVVSIGIGDQFKFAAGTLQIGEK